MGTELSTEIRLPTAISSGLGGYHGHVDIHRPNGWSRGVAARNFGAPVDLSKGYKGAILAAAVLESGTSGVEAQFVESQVAQAIDKASEVMEGESPTATQEITEDRDRLERMARISPRARSA